MKKWTLQNKEGIPKILVAAKGNLVTSYLSFRKRPQGI
uniref:Uncharacterized protein n=1 Tax=Vitis vinifera TaxID=29760 RepID=F6HLW2_VITVI